MLNQNACVDREKLFAYVHKMLEPVDAAEVREHLEHCADCRRLEADFAELDAALEEWKGQEPSPWFDARLRQALSQRAPRSAFGMLFSFPAPRVFAGAVLAAVLVAGVFLVREFMSPRHRGPVSVSPTAVATNPSPAVVTVSDAENELKMYQDLAVLEDYDMLADFDVLSELPKKEKKVVN